ncbi:ABC transporter ATP-binding protein [Paenibacillus roseipurpureus]|uniref:ABC transporter ATP-binding protein n=1 Tax=Paenibacillus roseopurpureus TaxID=2918901 RepID=A0AA96LSA8_9BACL|nr:ABC transporter ATP-binding protein [Paenibacillus sp. MBLB1832]WNR43810.1 ABC transporter ATP-binding protein [Paenibacillus sp. MBLB1832]
MKQLLHFARELHVFAGKILYLNVIGMVIVSLLEGAGILLLLPLISISGVISISNSSNPISKLAGIVQHMPVAWSLAILLAAYLLLITCQTLLQQNLNHRNLRILMGFTNHIRMETYRSLLQANWAFFMSKRKSDLINALTEELSRVVRGTNLLLQFITAVIFTGIQIGIAFWLSPSITLFVIVAGTILAYFSRRWIKKSRMVGTESTEIAQSYLGGISDHFNGVKDIKSNSLEASRIAWLRDWCKRIEAEQLKMNAIRNHSQTFYKITSTFLIASLIFVSIQLFKAQPSQLVLIILIFSRLWPRFTGIQSNLEQIASCIPAFQSILLLQEESAGAMEYNEKELVKQSTPMPVHQGISCQNVYFRYNKQELAYQLENIQVHIPANQTTAIVGRSGAGKSTLIDIVMGLLQPDQGQVCIDGVPLTRENLLAFRRSISYVPQDPFLFNGTIRENLLMIKPQATEEELWEALEFSISAEFVRRLPQGMDTLIGDRGVRLSGGERQRLVLARAILRKTSILVLDEASSALDTENEAKILAALDQLKGKMTIIVIAHRLSTIRNADQVIVVDRGVVVQNGKFGQLATEKKSLLNHLLEQQVIVMPHG